VTTPGTRATPAGLTGTRDSTAATAEGPRPSPAAAARGPAARDQTRPQAAGTHSHSGRHRVSLLTAWNAAARTSVSGANNAPAATAVTPAAASVSARRGVPSGIR
jgi:hypothetical protein